MKTFAAIVLAFAAVAVQADPEFKACAGFEDNSYVDPWKLTINPDPIVAKEGASVSVHFDATVLKTLPVGTKVDFKMVKDGIPLPCLPVSTNLGWGWGETWKSKLYIFLYKDNSV